ncbi:MAG TPA: carboxypeptidase regulatory-like domain-containing protein, partial [Pyrinomonadaceae bacterium]|nr:carboxypeptidase regulatory-like domain-containing protein [Pyrinomonadaceae bacterium]
MRNASQFLFRFLLLGVVLFFLSAAAMAQSTATLQGTVRDQKGDVVAGAKVTAKNQGTGIERTTQTDSEGNYQLAALPVGNYSVEVEMQGFKRQLLNSLTIEVGRTLVRDFSLEVGGLEQSVTVTAEAPVIESATTSVGQVITQRTVQEIPLNGRHFVDLGLLIPGSVTPPQNGFLTAPL